MTRSVFDNMTETPQTTLPNITTAENEIYGTSVITDDVMKTLDPAISFLTLPLNILGVITNTINIRVFLQQGIRNDSTNIGFLCLSICDLFGCAVIIPYPLCFFVKYVNGLGPYYTCVSFTSLVSHVHNPLQQIAAWTTVYLSMIRCLCVLFPLKVKLMFTPKLTIAFLTFISIFFVAFQISYSGFLNLVWVYHNQLNTSFAIITDSNTAQIALYYRQLITNQILPVIAVVIVSINTALLGKKLREVKKWRQKNSTTSSTEAQDSTKKPLASKEIELIKLVNTVTSIFLVCMLMGFLPSIGVMYFPGVTFAGINRNLFYMVFLIRYVFDAINSSINFFFYIRVSSRYKTAFAESFPGCVRQVSDAS